MTKRYLFATVLALGTCLPTLCGQDKDDNKAVSDLMRRKLTNSQKVLEGIAVNDPDLIGKHARELIEISKAAEWRVLKTPQYEVFSNEFRRNAESLIRKAKEKNLDGAVLAYVDMTLNCVKCHRHVREVRMARAK